MALTQMQLIQSLGEALAWFEREMNWGVPATELRYLCGRIGELYVAMITNGQMATEVNQRGYDVVSAAGERISVKTTAQCGYAGHVSFNLDSLDQVDRVVVLRVNTEEMQVEVLLDKPVGKVRSLFSGSIGGRTSLPLCRLVVRPPVTASPQAIREVSYEDYVLRELETGSIEVVKNGISVVPVKPVLREIARSLHFGLLNSNGNPLNTRQLGTQIINGLQALGAGLDHNSDHPVTPPPASDRRV